MAIDRHIETVSACFRENINPVASLGFIGLATDRASLPDFRDFVAFVPGIEVHATRIPFVEKATPETLADMAGHLKRGAELLVPGQPLGSISFSCTSGTIAIGCDAVREEIAAVRPESAIATPIEAAVDALRGLGCKRISLLFPYLMRTSHMVADFFEVEGFKLDRIATFDLGGDPEMNKVDPDCLYDVGVSTCAAESDALFISCTGWRTFPITERLEAALGRPVVSSNQALAWKALRSAGVKDQDAHRGALFSML